MSVSTNGNVSVQEYNKMSQYKDLDIKTEKMWHLEN